MRIAEIKTVWLADGPHEVHQDSAKIVSAGELAPLLAEPLIEFFEVVRSGDQPALRRRVLVPMRHVLAVATELSQLDWPVSPDAVVTLLSDC